MGDLNAINLEDCEVPLGLPGNLGGGASDSRDPLLPNLNVAVFLADYDWPQEASSSFRQSQVGQKLLPMLCDSVAHLYPEASFTILSSPSTDIPDLPYNIDVRRRPLGHQQLVYDRLLHYIAFLEQASGDSAYLFLDSDMLMLKRLQLDVAEDWDIGIAYKRCGDWVNSGMILVRPHRHERALDFFREAARICKERYSSKLQWGAVQPALRDAIGMTEMPKKLQIKKASTARVLLLPIRKFAFFAPWYARLYTPNTWILHFCGGRKDLMPDFYRLRIAKNAPSSLPSSAAATNADRPPRRVDARLFHDLYDDHRILFKEWLRRLRVARADRWRSLMGREA